MTVTVDGNNMWGTIDNNEKTYRHNEPGRPLNSFSKSIPWDTKNFLKSGSFQNNNILHRTPNPLTLSLGS